MPFVKGQSGNPSGRKPGIPDKVSQEVRALARQLFDASYWKRTKDKLLDGSLPPGIETKLLAYAYGEPVNDQQKNTGITVNIGFIGQGPPATRAEIVDAVDIAADIADMASTARVTLLGAGE